MNDCDYKSPNSNDSDCKCHSKAKDTIINNNTSSNNMNDSKESLLSLKSPHNVDLQICISQEHRQNSEKS